MTGGQALWPKWLGDKLAVQRCTACSLMPAFPRIACPRCFGELAWVPLAGTGTVAAVAIVRRALAPAFKGHLPIVLAAITLDEGPEVLSTIVGHGRLDAKVGSRVVPATETWSSLAQFELDD